jgi:hypothetical protein
LALSVNADKPFNYCAHYSIKNKNMDSNMILTWSILILATISLIVFLKIRNRNRGKKAFSVLQNFANGINSNISSFDSWDKTLIGIDNGEINKLFFLRTISNKEYREVINLSEVMSCRLVLDQRTVQYNKEKVNAIDKIDLVFSFVNTHKQDVKLEFYNADYDQLTLTGELQLAQKWSGIVKSILVTNKKLEKEVNKANIQVPSALNEPAIHAHVPAHPSKRKSKYTASKIHAI